MAEVVQKHSGSGSRPEGTSDERSAAARVREMFDAIAPRYDLLNHLLSLNIDRYWWWRMARRFRSILASPNAKVLDVCCGTGDMTLALRRHAPAEAAPYLGIDFAHQMLVRGEPKVRHKGIVVVEADALQLPFAAERFDLATSAFGFRNLANYDAGLREIARVLRAGGEIGILDFGEPGGLFGRIFDLYFRHVLPKLGTVISGVRGPYAYLPASVERFPSPQTMLENMRAAGFREVSWTPMTFGIVGIYWGKK